MGFFVFVILFVVGIGVAVMWFHNRVNEAWENVAKEKRLSYFGEPGKRKIYGSRNDMILEVRTEKAGKSIWTFFEADFIEPLPFSVRLAPQIFFSEHGDGFLSQVDLDTGDRDFDRDVIVGAEDSKQVRDFLDARARAAILMLRAQFDFFEVNEDRVMARREMLIHKERDLIGNIERFEKSVREIWESALEAAEPPPVPPPLPSKRKTLVEVKEEAPVVDPPSESPDSATTAAEPKRKEEDPPTSFEIVAEESVEPKEPAAVAEKVEFPEVAGEVVDEAFAKRCLEIFAECKGRYAMQQLFDEMLKGEEIVATLPLERVEPFSIDVRYGRGPGVLRTFLLGELPNGERLKLVADTGADRSLSEVRFRIDATDTVLGSLFAMDPFSHTLFLRSSVPEDSESGSAAELSPTA